MQNSHHSSRSAKKVFGVIWLPMVRPASAPPSPSLGQLCSLRAMASTAVSVSRLVIFCLASFVLRAPGQLRRLWARTRATVSELWPPPPSLISFQLRWLRTLTSSGLRPRASSAVSKPVPAPPPSPSAFQPRCLRILVSSAVSEPWLGPPSPSPQKAPGPGPALVFEPRASSTVSEYSGTRVSIYNIHPLVLDWACPPLKVWGAAAHLPPAPTPLVPFLLARLRTIGIVSTGVCSSTNWLKSTNRIFKAAVYFLGFIIYRNI